MPSIRRIATAEEATRPTPEEIAAAFVQVPGTSVQIQAEADAAEDDIAGRIRQAMGAAPDDAVRVKLYRRALLTRRLEWCEDFPPEAVINGADELIRSNWGPGAYELRVVGSAGILSRFQMEIAARAERYTPPAPPPPAIPDALAAVLGRMVEMQGAIMAKLSEPPPPAPPPMGMAELLGVLSTAKGLFTAPPAPPAAAPLGIVEMAAQMRALREVAEEFNPAPADPDNPMTALNGLLGVVGEAMKQRSSNPTPATPSTLPAVQVPASLEAGAPESTGDSMSQQYLQGIASGVIERAAANVPATDCAQWLADVLPEEFFPMLQLPNWLDMLCSAMPALTPHRAYLDACRAPLLEILKAD